MCQGLESVSKSSFSEAMDLEWSCESKPFSESGLARNFSYRNPILTSVFFFTGDFGRNMISISRKEVV